MLWRWRSFGREMDRVVMVDEDEVRDAMRAYFVIRIMVLRGRVHRAGGLPEGSAKWRSASGTV